MKSAPGSPMTLGNAATAKVRLIVWCEAYGHQVEPPSRGDGRAIRRRNQRSRLARPPRMLTLRQPRERYGGHRDRAAI